LSFYLCPFTDKPVNESTNQPVNGDAMDNLEFQTLTAGELREYINSRKEKDYLVIDVRQESEYELGHIPGARLMPLGEVEARLFSLPTDQDLIFYCHNGGRSQWAASLAGESEISEKTVYHLMGGILAWEDTTLPGFPEVQLFERDQEPEQMLKTAINLEKGAWRFYQHALQLFDENPVREVLEQLSIAEKGHAKLIYRFLQNFESESPLSPFDQYYQNLAGDILEGGLTLEDAGNRLETYGTQSCTRFIEMALKIEYAAFDLYRVMADRTDNSEAREAFLAVAQAEKGHMRALVRSLVKCR
jgi:rubrerythrin/rhodanese-related sulfurtransferase